MAEYTGFSVKSSYILSLNTLSDTAIYDKAKAVGNVIIISKDADFHEIDQPVGVTTETYCY